MSAHDKYKQAHIRDAFKSNAASRLFGLRQQNEQHYQDIARKMVSGETTDSAIEDREDLNNIDKDRYIKTALVKSIERIRDAENTMGMLPDTKQAIEIIIGIMLSPTDMMHPTVNFSCESSAFDERVTALVSYVEDYFKNTYKLEGKLDEILWDILGKTGSYPVAILPETSFDHLINSNARVTMEDLTSSGMASYTDTPSLGYIGDGNVGSFESMSLVDMLKLDPTKMGKQPKFMGDEYNLTINDNFDELKRPLLSDKIFRQRSADIIAARRKEAMPEAYEKHVAEGMESITLDLGNDYARDDETKRELRKLYPRRDYLAAPIVRAKSKSVLGNTTTGHPKLIKLPTESVVRLYNPTNPREGAGGFVILDLNGHPLRMSELDYLQGAISAGTGLISDGGAILSNLMQSSANMNSADGGMSSSNGTHADFGVAAKVFQEQVEKNLLDRIATGTIGTGYQIADTDVPAMIMLARALQGKRTQLLYLPPDILCYMAVDYDKFGLGKTLLDDHKLLAAIRSMNVIVNAVASSKNAITKRVLDIQHAPEEKNPQKATKILLNEYVKSTHGDFPLHVNPTDQVNYLQRAGVQVRVQEHPRMPNTNFSVEYLNNQYSEINTTFDDFLRSQHAAGIGLPSELTGPGNDFAIQTVVQNALTSRRIAMLSNKMTEPLSGFVRGYVSSSSILSDGLRELIRGNGIKLKTSSGRPLSEDEVLEYFLSHLEVKLPRIDNTNIKEVAERFNDQRDAYKEVIDCFISSDWLSEDELGRLGGNDTLDKLKAYLVSYYMREWLKNNGLMGEVFELVTANADGKPMLDFGDERNRHLSNLVTAMMPMMKQDMKRSGDTNKELEEFESGLDNPPGDGDGGGGDYGSDSGGDSYGGDDGDEVGDFGDGEDDAADDFSEGGDDDGGDDDDAETDNDTPDMTEDGE